MTPDEAAGEVARERGLPRPELVRAGMNHTFRAGAEAIRVSTSEFQTPLHEITDALRAAGVAHARPTGPVIRFPELEVTTWRWVDASAPDIDFEALGDSVARLHRMGRSQFQALEPIGSCTRFAHLDLDAAFGSIRDDLDDAARSSLEAELASLSGWRDMVGAADQVICHGDMHWNNVIAPATLIDWDLLCSAPPSWDHAALIAGTRRWGLDTASYDQFASGYGIDFRGDELAELLVRLRDLAATIMMGVRAQLIAAADVEFQRRLRTWRGDPNAPTWTAL